MSRGSLLTPTGRCQPEKVLMVSCRPDSLPYKPFPEGASPPFGPIARRFGPTPALLWNNWRAHEYVILRRVNRKASLFLPVALKD
jgi:hypothetical protein